MSHRSRRHYAHNAAALLTVLLRRACAMHGHRDVINSSSISLKEQLHVYDLPKCIRTADPDFISIGRFAIGSGAFAADYLWTNPAGGSFNTPGNWSPNGPPTAGSNAVFNLGSSGYSVTASGNISPTTNIQINNDTLTGLYDATTLSVGYAPGSQGTLSPSGFLDVNVDASSPAGGLTVGVDGSGTLTESGSGNVTVVGHLVVAQNADSQGTITLNRSTLGTPGFGEMRSG